MSRVIADGLSDKALALISSSIDADTLNGIDSLGFDAAGAADTAVSDHVALADPHAQYALESITPVDFGSTTDDVDTLVKSGFYRVGTNANLPSGAYYGQLIVSRSSDTILQLVSSYNGRLWQRSGNPSNIGGSGSYSDWQEIPSLAGGAAANFTTMPQVGGDPIVESGSNADGEWTRWSDGTQVEFTTIAEELPTPIDIAGDVSNFDMARSSPLTGDWSGAAAKVHGRSAGGGGSRSDLAIVGRFNENVKVFRPIGLLTTSTGTIGTPCKHINISLMRFSRWN